MSTFLVKLHENMYPEAHASVRGFACYFFVCHRSLFDCRLQTWAQFTFLIVFFFLFFSESSKFELQLHEKSRSEIAAHTRVLRGGLHVGAMIAWPRLLPKCHWP